MRAAANPSVQRVQEALAAFGGEHRVIELAESARTAADAARALGCRVDQIVKSLVFRGRRTGRAILVTASGANRVDERKVAALVGEPVDKGDADYLLTWEELWAAAGHPNTVFRLSPADLARMTGGQVVGVK